MPSRGQTIKTATDERLTLLRPMVTRRYELTLQHEICCGCGTCATVCPKEAITLTEAVVAEGRLTAKPQVDIDAAKCIYCGECVAMCPTHALDMTINGQPEVPVLKGKAFPMLIRRMAVNQAPLEASADVSYIANCPSGALSADVVRDADGAVSSVSNVQLDRALCYNCTRCMEEGPAGGFEITKPYLGRVYLDVSLCPAGCQVCADACPTHAITYDGERVAVDERFCIYCGACERACPVPGAIRSVRTGFLHLPVESAAWSQALDKLVSYREAAREYAVKGQRKRREMAVKALLAGDEDKA
jgi:4Fe-4S ferredoxin